MTPDAAERYHMEERFQHGSLGSHFPYLWFHRSGGGAEAWAFGAPKFLFFPNHHQAVLVVPLDRF